MKKYLCLGCGFSYDEARGLPEHGIAAGTRWADIPDDWVCPDCNGLYAFVIDGEAEIAGRRLARRDSIALEGEAQIEIASRVAATDMLLIEMPL